MSRLDPQQVTVGAAVLWLVVFGIVAITVSVVALLFRDGFEGLFSYAAVVATGYTAVFLAFAGWNAVRGGAGDE